VASRAALGVIATALALGSAGCFEDQFLSLPPPDADPPTTQRLIVAPEQFIEANFVVDSPGARVTAAFASAGEFEWNLHRHDRDDFRQFDVIESGAASEGTLVFEAESDGLWSYQWTNMSVAAGFAIDIELTLEGDVTLYSWD